MRAEISYIVHSTESYEKILESIARVLGIDVRRASVTRMDVSGHYGNPLTYVKMKLQPDMAEKVLRRILEMLPSYDKLDLLNNLDSYMEGSKLYLRLDKQGMCIGRVSLSEADAVRIVFRNVGRGAVEKMLRSAMEGGK